MDERPLSYEGGRDIVSERGRIGANKTACPRKNSRTAGPLRKPGQTSFVMSRRPRGGSGKQRNPRCRDPDSVTPEGSTMRHRAEAHFGGSFIATIEFPSRGGG